MVAKSHCKVHYGDGGDEEEAELEEFYDYSSRFCSFLYMGLFRWPLFCCVSSFKHLCMLVYLTWTAYILGFSYVDEAGKQLVVSGEMANSVELGSGGSELIITTRSDEGISTKALGSREFMRYYRQKPRPSPNHMAITAAVAARFVSNPLC